MPTPGGSPTCHDRDDLSQYLAEQTPIILDVWEGRVRRELTASRDEDAPALRDHLPVLLLRLAQALSPLTPETDLCMPGDICREHGRERAWMNGYSLQHVLREYSLPREVILAILEEKGSVPRPERERLHRFLDRAMEDAATEFARITTEALHRSEENYRAMFEMAAVGKAQAESFTGRILQVNRKLCEITGYSEAELLGMSLAGLTRPEDRAADPAGHERMLRGDTAEHSVEARFLRREGQAIWVTLNTALIRASDHSPLRIAVAIQDISERVRLRQELRQRAEELAEANRKKNEFLALLAHEMRTPISAISNALFILDNLELPNDRSPRLLETASRQARHLARFAEDLVDVARITHGRMELRRERVDLASVAREAAQGSPPLIEARGQSFAGQFAERPVWIEADPVRVKQVVTNLLNNAAKYAD